MKKPLYLLSALAMLAFTVVVFANPNKDGQIASNVLYSSVMDAGGVSGAVLVAEDNPELDSYAANPGEYEDEINKTVDDKKENVVHKKVSKKTR